MPIMTLREQLSLPSNSPLEGKEVHWSFVDILKIEGLYILFTLLIPMPHKFSANRWQMQLTQWIALALTYASYRHFNFWPDYTYFGLRWSDFKRYFSQGVIWGVLVKVVPTALAIMVVLIAAQFIPIEGDMGNNPLPNLARLDAVWILLAIDIAFVVPVFEEVIFRGLLYGLMRKRYGVKRAIIFSSLVFGLMHGLGFVIVFAVLAGIGFALLYERTGSLAPCIIAHVVGNLASVLISAAAFLP